MPRKTKKPGKRAKRRVDRVRESRERRDKERVAPATIEPPNTAAIDPSESGEKTILGKVEAGNPMSTNQNTVEVDEAALIAEATRAAESAPKIEGAPPMDGELVGEPTRQPTPEEVLKGYTIVAEAGVSWAARMAAPNWQLKPERKTKLAEALAQAAVLWFPDQVLPPKWAVLLVVADALGEIVSDNYDQEAGDYRPLKLKNVTPAKQTNPAKTEAV